MKPIPLIEHMEHRQRNAKEVLDFLLTTENPDEIERIFVWYEKDGQAYYVPGSDSRDFTNADIYWALSKLMLHFMETE